MSRGLHIEQYQLYDFLMDESFRAVVENPEHPKSSDWHMILEAYPEKKAVAERARAFILSGQYRNLSFSQQENQALWNEIHIKTIATAQIIDHPKANNKSVFGKKWLRAAVIFIPLLAAILLIFFSQNGPPSPQKIVAEHIVKQTQYGQKLQITFSDGTQVKLNADSKLTYDHPFAATQREVFLEGEAYFDVTPDPNRPFIVHTGKVTTQVLGTSFNVKTYADHASIEVAVITGKVMVANNDSSSASGSVILQPSEMATYDKHSLTPQVSVVDVSQITAWNRDILLFDNASFEEVVYKLKRWYGVEFKILRKDPIKKGFDGSFQHKSLEHVLDGIGYTSDFSYEIQGDTVYIK